MCMRERLIKCASCMMHPEGVLAPRDGDEKVVLGVVMVHPLVLLPVDHTLPRDAFPRLQNAQVKRMLKHCCSKTSITRVVTERGG